MGNLPPLATVASSDPDNDDDGKDRDLSPVALPGEEHDDGTLEQYKIPFRLHLKFLSYLLLFSLLVRTILSYVPPAYVSFLIYILYFNIKKREHKRD